MASFKKYLFTLFFLVWEACKRVRGSWRRREWAKLCRWGLIAGNLVLITAWVCIGLRNLWAA